MISNWGLRHSATVILSCYSDTIWEHVWYLGHIDIALQEYCRWRWYTSIAIKRDWFGVWFVWANVHSMEYGNFYGKIWACHVRYTSHDITLFGKVSLDLSAFFSACILRICIYGLWYVIYDIWIYVISYHAHSMIENYSNSRGEVVT